MKVKISCKHLEHSPWLDMKIQEKSERISKYLNGNVSVDWVCWTDEGSHWAEVKVHNGHEDFFAKASTESMYKTLDKVIHKLERQLEKQKDQRNRMHNQTGVKKFEIPDYDEEIV